MSLVQLDIRGISYSQTQTGAYALVLSEHKRKRTLPIVIGAFEAQSIAIALEKEISPPRPLTHDLFKNFAHTYSIHIKEIIIYKLIDGVFYSKMICQKEGEEEISLDARTSDAIALAIRFNAPIYTYESILEKAGIYLQQDEEIEGEIELEEEEPDEEVIEKKVSKLVTSDKPDTSEYSGLSDKELEAKLKQAIAKEDYELAALIRDELNKRS